MKTLWLRNEFATIAIELNEDANGPRMKMEDLKSGRIRYFDPIELEGLIAADDGELLKFADPARMFK